MSCVGVLRGCTENTKGLTIPIFRWKSTTVGRDSSCDIVLKDHTVSQFHCEFKATTIEFESVVHLTNTSRNGTYLNESLVGKDRTVTLFPGCIVSFAFGHISFIFIQKQKCHKNKNIPDSFLLKDQKMSIPGLSLGSGSQASIYLAYMTSKPARQLVYRIKTSGQAAYDNQHEIDMLKTNRHVNIISLVAMDGENMIMPAFPGGSLDRFILGRDRFTQSEVFFVFYQLMSGLQYLHTKGIIHRDIKPDNILLAGTTLKSRVVIADFGLAFYNKEEGKTHLNHGTYSYFAPEIVRETGNLAQFTPKSDCWATGLVLLTMIDKHPFEDYDKNEESLREDILNVNLDSHISKNHPDFKNLLSGLLQVDASQRYSASECLQSNWMIERANKDFFTEYELMVLQHFTEERRTWFGEEAKNDGHYCLHHFPPPTEEPAYRVRKTHIRPKVKKSSYRVNIQTLSSSKSVVEDWIEAVNEERFTRSDHRSRQ